MEEIDYVYLANAIANLSGIPIRYYHCDDLVFYKSIVKLAKDPITLVKDELFKIEDHVSYFCSSDLLYYGIIRKGDERIIIGPSYIVTPDDRSIKELAFRLDVEDIDKEKFISNFKAILSMPIESLIQMLVCINYIINDEKLYIDQVVIRNQEQENLKLVQNKLTIEKEFDPAIDNDAMLHNTLTTEDTVLKMIKSGDLKAFDEFVRNIPPVRGGKLATNALRQQKDLFIVTVTLASRAAISGGLDVEESLSLSDSYIQRCEHLSTVESISNLQFYVIKDYIKRVNGLQVASNKTPLVKEVSKYIMRNIANKMTVESIADDLYISRSRLSTKFKDETGVNLSDYINIQKIEEAKTLLEYTDKSLLAISNYLSFSSPGHFSNLFKKIVGMSPLNYRQLKEKS